MARRMARAVGDDGHVLATDIDPTHLVAEGNLTYASTTCAPNRHPGTRST